MVSLGLVTALDNRAGEIGCTGDPVGTREPYVALVVGRLLARLTTSSAPFMIVRPTRHHRPARTSCFLSICSSALCRLSVELIITLHPPDSVHLVPMAGPAWAPPSHTRQLIDRLPCFTYHWGTPRIGVAGNSDISHWK